ncbi:MAG TPA: TonB-dependent receptor, partial [Desulfomonilia bacterium]|nr:TonB-dependent receptor [Desulfomonilia bacterium]
MDHRIVKLLIVILSAALLFFNSPIRAASDIVIVVTPTMEKKVQGSLAEKAPTSFSDIITPGPEVSGLVDTQEALRKASSIDLSDYGGAQTSPVMLRGSDFQQTLITLDGIPMNPVTGDIVDISRFMLPDLDQVEIIKGSNSAEFGMAAMGGVINLVTKNPAMVDEYDFTASQGTYDYGLYHGHISTHAGGVGILANLTHAFADNGFRYERDDKTWTRRENNGTNNTTGLMKALFNVQGWQTSLMGNFIDQQSGSPGSEGTAGIITPHDKVNFSQDTFLMETQKPLSDDQLLDMRVWMVTNRTHNQSDMFGNSITQLVDKNFSAAYTKKLGIFTLTPGVQYLLERMNSKDFGIHSRSTASGNFSADIDIKPVILDLAGRYDHSYSFKDRWSYHAGAAWNIIDHVQLKTNAGTGYLEPTMGQLYAPSTFFTFIRNPDLKPESSFSWDIGPSVSLNTCGFSVDYFITAFRDLIKMDFPAPNSF